MADRAHVTSVEAIEAFRAALIVYLTKVRPVMEDACDEVARTRQWLQYDRRLHWENEVRRRTKTLEAAQQELFGARLSNLREPNAIQQAAVQRAKRALAEAEEKLRMVKRWTLEFETRAEPLVKELEHLRTLLANDLPKAAAKLALTVRALDAYTGVALPTGPAPVASAPADGTPEAQTGATGSRPAEGGAS